jgi:dipeptidyl aminopeptidase/acylaminoacyl peptidase
MNPGVTYATYKDYTVVSSALRGGVSEGTDEFGGKDVNDMKNLIKFIPEIAKELGVHIQPSCVFMIGPSRGGMEMFLTLAHFPELQKRVNKVVAISAILDLHQLIHDRPDDMKVMLESHFGLQEGSKGKEWIAKRDPLNTIPYISQSLPILVIQGTHDTRIGLAEGRRMVQALKQTGHNVSYWEVKGGDHVLMNHPQIMNDIAHWLESNSPCMSIRLPRSDKKEIVQNQ